MARVLGFPASPTEGKPHKAITDVLRSSLATVYNQTDMDVCGSCIGLAYLRGGTPPSLHPLFMVLLLKFKELVCVKAT